MGKREKTHKKKDGKDVVSRQGEIIIVSKEETQINEVMQKSIQREKQIRGGAKAKEKQEFQTNEIPGTARQMKKGVCKQSKNCLLYTSDAADDMQCVDLGGRRIIIKKNTITIYLNSDQ
eukprot:TRINITY_DN25335_c0_g1_i1.p2 TRINITY_DN25335_c0_g1~~TRINITY_DN25335_c0_g1_i1.p2  ORF type:complete len:119 (-),score=23.14 TRINITY_DN25335_c0_g1_i1:6-362(-)